MFQAPFVTIILNHKVMLMVNNLVPSKYTLTLFNCLAYDFYRNIILIHRVECSPIRKVLQCKTRDVWDAIILFPLVSCSVQPKVAFRY